MSRTIHPAKRIFDVAFILLSLPIAAPFSGIVFSAIFIEHLLRGRPLDPLLYSEIRISAGTPFRLYKFNIFRDEVIERLRREGAFIETKQLEHSGGVTHIGWCLKQIYMDELPQLWCVLRGDMSIVGPRPVNTLSFERFVREGITVKSEIKAGITGPFQSLKDERTASAHLLDRWYIEYVRANPWYRILLNDCAILLRTTRVIIKAKGI